MEPPFEWAIGAGGSSSYTESTDGHRPTTNPNQVEYEQQHISGQPISQYDMQGASQRYPPGGAVGPGMETMGDQGNTWQHGHEHGHEHSDHQRLHSNPHLHQPQHPIHPAIVDLSIHTPVTGRGQLPLGLSPANQAMALPYSHDPYAPVALEDNRDFDIGQAGPSNYAMYHRMHESDVSTFQPPTTAMPPQHPPPSQQQQQGGVSSHFRIPSGTESDQPSSHPTPSFPPRPLPVQISGPLPTHTSTRHYPNGTTGPSLKRGMACAFCRRRKLRCSAERPMCGNCIKYKKVCEYGPPPGGEDDEKPETSGLPGVQIPSGQDIPHRTESTTSLTDSLQTPVDQPGSSVSASFPPRMGWDAMMHSQSSRPPSFPLSISASPDIAPPPYLVPEGYQLPFTTQHQQPLQHSPLLVQANPPLPDPSQFSQYGTLSFPPWGAHDVPGYPAVPPSTVPPSTVISGSYSGPAMAVPLPDPFEMVSPHHAPSSGIQFPNQDAQTTHSLPASTMSPSSATSLPIPTNLPPPPMRRRPSQKVSPPSMGGIHSRGSDDPPPPSMLVDPTQPYAHAVPAPAHVVMFAVDNKPFSGQDPLDALTERFGEFLFSPSEAKAGSVGKAIEGSVKRRKQSVTVEKKEGLGARMQLIQPVMETDGLTNSARETLLGVFLAHSRLFLEMSVPRFRYRMTFNDRRRPSLALLNAMYLWATHISAAPKVSPLTETFFQTAYQQLQIQASRADRLLDAIRAAILLSIYSSTSGKLQDGWILAGLAIRLCVTCGLHQIPSCKFRPPPVRNPLLRQKTFILPPPEDKVELAERIHTFWASYSIERCGTLVTGFPSAIRDDDIMTPFAPSLADIASGNVTSQDDVTVRDLYRFCSIESSNITQLPAHGSTSRTYASSARWLKAVTILDRSARITLLDPSEDSDYARAWSTYALASAGATPPAPWLDQPKYKSPAEYGIVKLGIDQLRESMGVEGIFPVDRRRNAQIDKAAEPFVASHTIIMHFLFNAAYMFLHDINSFDCDNTEALNSARRCVSLIKDLPQMPITDVDPFMVVVWGMVAKTFLKEMHRQRLQGDAASALAAEEDVDVILGEMKRVGSHTILPRTQAIGVEVLKNMDSRAFASGASSAPSSAGLSN